MMQVMDEQNADVVYGQRKTRESEPFKRASAALFYRLLGRLTDTNIPKDTGDFRLISRRAVDILASMPESSRYLRGMISWIGLKQIALPYARQPRLTGTTKYPLRKMIRFALDAITSFSIVPMRLASYTGAAFGVIGLALLAYVLRAWPSGKTAARLDQLDGRRMLAFIGSVQLLPWRVRRVSGPPCTWKPNAARFHHRKRDASWRGRQSIQIKHPHRHPVQAAPLRGADTGSSMTGWIPAHRFANAQLVGDDAAIACAYPSLSPNLGFGELRVSLRGKKPLYINDLFLASILTLSLYINDLNG